MLLSSTIGRNKSLIPGEVISALINGTEHFLEKLRNLGIGIYLTGGETADVGDLVRTVIVDSTVTTRIRRDEVIENNLQPATSSWPLPLTDKPPTRTATTAAWAATASHRRGTTC